MASAIPGEAYIVWTTSLVKQSEMFWKQPNINVPREKNTKNILKSEATKQYPRYFIGTLTISNSEAYFKHIFFKTVFAMKPAEKTPETLSRTEERAKAMSSKERSKAPT